MSGAHRGTARPSSLITGGATLLLAALGVALFFYFRGDGGVLPLVRDPDPEPEVPEFTFTVGKAPAIALTRAPKKGTHRQTVEEIHEMLDRLYVAGFVDPGLWEEGQFTAFLEQFAGAAAKGARDDLDDLTVNRAAADLALVTPQTGRLDVSLFYGAKRQPVAAVARTVFGALGDLSAGGQISIEHRGKFILQRIGGRWAIVGYEVTGQIGQLAGSATAGTPSPSEGTAP